MTIRPLHDRILAKRLAEEDKTSGGLFIPDNAKEKPLEALVISVGNGKILESGRTQALSVKAGDKVLIGKYSGSEVKLDGKDHIFCAKTTSSRFSRNRERQQWPPKKSCATVTLACKSRMGSIRLPMR